VKRKHVSMTVPDDAWLILWTPDDLWWRANRCGYCKDMLGAGIYSKQEATRQEASREGDKAVKLSEALKRVELGTVGEWFETRARERDEP
jgi:hypothetical protein